VPVNQQADIFLSGKPFMLQRAKGFRGRAWSRGGAKSVPGSGTPGESHFSTTAPDVAFADTFDDFSGGFGYAYRGPSTPPGAVHWSEGFDLRFPRQAVHAQALVQATLWDDIDGAQAGGVSWLYDLPMKAPVPPAGFAAVHAYGKRQNLVGNRDSFRFYPRKASFPPAVEGTALTTTTQLGLEGPPALFGSFFYLGMAGSGFYRADLDGVIGTQGTLPHQGFVNAGPKLWAKVGAPGRAVHMRSIAAGAGGMVDADWSATLTVGNGQRPIKDLAALGGQVFCGVSDGLYASDTSGTFQNVTGELSGQANDDNFRDLTVHDGRVVGVTVAGVYAYDPVTTTTARVRNLGPAARSNRSPVSGYPTAVESFGGWLYAGLWTGSQSYLLAGEEETGGGPFKWNVLNRVPVPGRIGRIHVDGITYGSGLPAVSVPNRLWLAMEGSFGAMLPNTDGTAPLYFQPIPRMGGNPLAPQAAFSANYNGSARLDLPSWDRNAPGTTKVLESVEVWCDALASGSRYGNVYLTLDHGQRVLVGTANTSPVSLIPLGSLGNGYFPSCKSYELGYESFTNTAGTCPVLHSLVVRGKLRPTVVDTISAAVRIADDLPDRRGTPMRPGAVQLDELRAMADPRRSGGVPVQLVDLAGATQYVVLDPELPEYEVYQEVDDAPEIGVTVRMAVMNFSGNQ
jgi:hypothetical protein